MKEKTANAKKLKRYRERLRERAWDAIGRVCALCPSFAIEFAHVLPTGLNGASRGNYHRYQDVIRNPGSYRPMCKECHYLFDNDEEFCVEAQAKLGLTTQEQEQQDAVA